jgi:hypothetical protein
MHFAFSFWENPRKIAEPRVRACRKRTRTVLLLKSENNSPLMFLSIEVLNVEVGVSVLLIFASLPDCSQNQTAVSDTQHLLSDF